MEEIAHTFLRSFSFFLLPSPHIFHQADSSITSSAHRSFGYFNSFSQASKKDHIDYAMVRRKSVFLGSSPLYSIPTPHVDLYLASLSFF